MALGVCDIVGSNSVPRSSLKYLDSIGFKCHARVSERESVMLTECITLQNVVERLNLQRSVTQYGM